MLPIATFLAGSLLSILVPICLLIALLAWYDILFRRHGEPADASDIGRSGAEASAAGDTGAAAEASGAGETRRPPGRR